MTKKQVQQVTVLLGLILAILWQRFGSTTFASPSPQAPTEISAATTTPATSVSSTVATNALVVRGVDGDTIEVRVDGMQDDAKVRMLGVNTPESVDPRRPVQCFGKEASHFTKEMLEGKRIQLVEDPQADNIDKYQRLLRNIVLEDGTDYNLLLVQKGYANAYIDFPLNKQRKVQLTQAERLAREAGLGLWSTSTCSGTK